MRSTPRRRAREFALQGLYQRQLSGNSTEAIRQQIAEASGFAKADVDYFGELWPGVAAEFVEEVHRRGNGNGVRVIFAIFAK